MIKHNPFAAIAHGHSLAEAIVDAIREPLLVLDPDLRVIAASRSFYRTFAVMPRKTEGRLLFELGDGQWNILGLRAVLEDIIPKRRTVEAYEVEHEFDADGEPPHTGLGTSIVEALAHQLKATVEKSSGPEGTRVTVTAAEHQ